MPRYKLDLGGATIPLYKVMDKRFEQVDKRFDQLTSRMDHFMIWSFATTLTVINGVRVNLYF
jgi:hypothetical protein